MQLKNPRCTKKDRDVRDLKIIQKSAMCESAMGENAMSEISLYLFTLIFNFSNLYRWIFDIKKKKQAPILSTLAWISRSSTCRWNGTSWPFPPLGMLNITLAVMNPTLISPSTSRCAEKHCSTLSISSYRAWASLSSLSLSFIYLLTAEKK